MERHLKHIVIEHFPIGDEHYRDFRLSYQIFGRPLHSAPVVLVNHALTGNSTVTGVQGWWKNLIGTGKVIDLNTYTVIAIDIPGNGYDNEPDHLIADYQTMTTKLVASLFWKILDHLNAAFLYAVIGGSLGGGIAWEMAFQRPKSIRHLIPIAASYQASDWLIGNVYVQDTILNHSKKPLEDARIHAMLLYRTPSSLQNKFNLQFNTEENRYAVESWLEYHGRTLRSRFTLEAYKLMNHLLKTIGQHLTQKHLHHFATESNSVIHIIAVDSDCMFTAEAQFEHYKKLKKHKKEVHYKKIESIHGHDAFLIEYEQLNQLLKDIF